MEGWRVEEETRMARGFSSHVALTSYGRECNLHSGFGYRSSDEWDCCRIWERFIDPGGDFVKRAFMCFFILLLVDIIVLSIRFRNAYKKNESFYHFRRVNLVLGEIN